MQDFNNEELIRIAKSISNQALIEKKGGNKQRAIARFDVNMVNSNGEHLSHVWLSSASVGPNFQNGPRETGSSYIPKNSSIGISLSTDDFGKFTYRENHKYRKNVFYTREAEFYSKAVYSRNNNSIINVGVDSVDGLSTRIQSLDQYLKNLERIEKEIQQKQKEQEERERLRNQAEKEREEQEKALAKAKADEAERLRAELEAKIAEEKAYEEQIRKEKEEILKLEQEKQLAEELKSQVSLSYRTGHEMRYQEMVDGSQTLVKISHLYDGVPIVIDGGPGTGKTTTSIARLKFLIDPLMAEQESCKLTEAQLAKLTDPVSVDNHWIFLSPSNLLSQYLKSALSAEGLSNKIGNVSPFENFRIKRLHEYCITASLKDSGKAPFMPIKSNNELYYTCLICDGEQAMQSFASYYIAHLTKPLRSVLSINTSGYAWQKCAVSIQLLCKDLDSINTLTDLIKLYHNLHSHESLNVEKFSAELKLKTEKIANKIKNSIKEDAETVEYLAMLFDEWQHNSTIHETEELDITDEEEIQVDVESIEGKIYSSLKSLLPRLGVQEFDKTIELSKRQKEFYELVSEHIEKSDVSEIADLAWFYRNFGSLCRGYEHSMFRPLCKLYKAFRKEQLRSEVSIYDSALLKEVCAWKGGRGLHPDEQSLLLGVINNMMLSVVKWSRPQFDSLKHHYAKAYKNSVKHVICVDEASDYSDLDYYCIASFAHYDFSSITLCGDIMQGLGHKRLQSWDSLKKWVFPNLKIYSLKKSYRQWPTLLDVSKRMYEDDLKREAPFTSALTRQQCEPVPLAFISTNEEAKIDWLAQRINQVCENLEELPSIAIFVNDNEDINQFMEFISDHDEMQKFAIEDCTRGNQGRADSIRVFYLSQVKGMEFEAVFFHNIDKANVTDEEMLRRHIYVGISRAVSHLGATFESSNSKIISYFEMNSKW